MQNVNLLIFFSFIILTSLTLPHGTGKVNQCTHLLILRLNSDTLLTLNSSETIRFVFAEMQLLKKAVNADVVPY
jgi:hypothetical protein